MSKATSIKDAIKKWEDKHPGENIYEATDVGFQFQFPPIEKMDNTLSTLTKARFASTTCSINIITFINHSCMQSFLLYTRFAGTHFYVC